MRTTILTLCGAILVSGIWGCSQRKRKNPLDPQNPETLGRLQQPNVLSDRHSVTLNWKPVELDDILGYNIFRRIEGQSDLKNINFVSSSNSSFVDGNRAYEEEVEYRISVVTSGYESPLSDSVTITPGPYNYWVIDSYLGEIVKLTYDVNHIMTQSSYAPYPVAIATDSISRAVWVIDLMGYLFKFNSDGEMSYWVDGLTRPNHLSIDPLNGTIWISVDDGTQLVQFDTSGVQQWEISGFQKISDMSCFGSQGECWIADEVGKDITLISSTGAQELKVEDKFDFPTSISYFQRGEWLWIADDLKLFRVWPDGKVEETVRLEHTIFSISTDQATGDCWVIVDLEDGVESEILKLDVNGEILVRAEGFSLAQDLIANDFNGGCIVADTGNYRVVRLSRYGDIIGTLEGFGAPWRMAVE